MKKLFITVLIFRLVISFLPAMGIDMGCWKAWAMRMVEVGPQNFYSTQIFTDNPPGYLYIFWVVGWFKGWLEGLIGLGAVNFEWLLKLPANLFDLGTGLLIYKIISHKRGGLARLGFLLYTLNPAIWFNSSVFGQFDGAGVFFGLLSVYLLLEKKRIGWAAVALAVAWAVKPQAIALAPAVGILALMSLKSPKFLKLLRGVGVFVLTTLLLYWPFFSNNPLGGIFYVFSRMNNIYTCTTCFAFNFWGIFGNWQNDQALFLGAPLMWWGIILAGVGMLGVLGRLVLVKFDKLDKLGQIYLAIAISVMAFFMFVTRMHERYLLPFFAFFLISAILSKSKFLMLYYILISGLSLLNVYYPYANYNTNLHLTPGLVIWLGENFRLLSMISFGSFLVLLWWYFAYGTIDDRKWRVGVEDRKSKIDKKNPSSIINIPPLSSMLDHRSSIPKEAEKLPWSRREIIIVFSLVFVSFLIRVIRLDIPKTYYFDEVYHAFTAKEMLLGNKMAWEWWNTPPAGFAYEWTHPPLAKEAMVVGMKIFGENPFGWRFPGVLAGVGVIFLIYLLGKQLFNTRVGLIAAFLGSCDGLLFTQSRIGMNDIYFLFFMLLAFWLFLKQKWWGMAVALGLSLASKWTAIYGIGILGGLYVINQFSIKKISRRLLIGVLVFVILPLIIYLITYIPFFTSGHTWAQFDELQHQMWWYHTGLKATHPYTSPWYSWPLMQRPVWYYVNYGLNGQTVANIYGLGNPIVFWSGIIAICYMVLNLIRNTFSKEKFTIYNLQFLMNFFQISNFKFQIVLAGYFGFFLPWAFSPRIMFLYHYLPSLPFLCLALGWGLGKISNIKIINVINIIEIPGKTLTFLFLLFSFLLFLYFYPQLSALPVPKEWADQYFWFASWR